MKQKCTWCNTENEAERKICHACGLPAARKPTPPDDMGSSETESQLRSGTRWRALPVALGLLPLVAGLAFGGWFFWQRQEQARQAQEQRAVEAQRKKEEEAKRQRVEEARQRIPETVARARDELRQRNFNSGLSLVNEALLLVDAPELRETKVDLLNNAGRWNEAYLELQALLKLEPDKAYRHFAAGAFARNVKGSKEAIPHYEEAARLEEGNTTYQITLGKLYLQDGRNDDAFALLGKLVERDPNCVECWYHYGDALFAADQYDRAIAVFREGVKKFPSHYRRWFDLAVCLDNVARKNNDKTKEQEAATCYRKSLELQPMPNSVAAERIFKITNQRVPPELEAKSASEIALEPRGKVHVVRVSINGVEGRFILDSGASYTTVSESAARRFSLKPTRSRVEVNTANGTIQVPVAYGNLQVGQHKLNGGAILLMPDNKDRETDGLLGNDFLWRFDPQIDTHGHRLILRGYRGEKGCGRNEIQNTEIVCKLELLHPYLRIFRKYVHP